MTGGAIAGSPETQEKGPAGPSSLPDRLIGAIDFVGRLICAGTLAALFAALLANVVLRYAFGSGLTWAYEIHAVLLPWLVAGGIIIAAAQGRHIAVTLLPAMLKGSARTLLLALVHGITLVIAVSVIWSSQPILKASQFQTLSSLGIKQIWGYSSIVAAFGAIALISALELIRLAVRGAGDAPDPSLNSLS